MKTLLEGIKPGRTEVRALVHLGPPSPPELGGSSTRAETYLTVACFRGLIPAQIALRMVRALRESLQVKKFSSHFAVLSQTIQPYELMVWNSQAFDGSRRAPLQVVHFPVP